MEHRFKTRFIEAAAFGLIAAGILTASILILARRAPSFQLPDGSTLRLQYVTYQQTPQPAWLRKAREWCAKKLGVPDLSRNVTPTNSVILWFSRREKLTEKYMDFGSLSHASIVDSHGCEFDADSIMAVHTDKSQSGSRLLPKAPPGSRYILASAAFPVVPRREKTFDIHLYDGSRRRRDQR